MHYESFKNLTAGIQSIATVLALGVGAFWTYIRFIRTGESRSKVDIDADLLFIREQSGEWIVEAVVLVKNPGNVRLGIKDLYCELLYAIPSDNLRSESVSTDISNKDEIVIDTFHRAMKRYRVQSDDGVFLGPAERSRFSFLALLPKQAVIVVLKCEITERNAIVDALFVGDRHYRKNQRKEIANIECVEKCYAVPPIPGKIATP